MNSDPKFDQKPEVLPDDGSEGTDDLSEEVPGFEQADWDEITSGVLTREEISIEELEEGDVEELPDEDDDNPYMDSDEALPDDEEERAIRRDLTKEGGSFDEI
jgi:hypothetical protein